jgi:hypothetical protein
VPQAALDAVLVAYAPPLRSAVRQCAETFQVMGEHDPGPSGQMVILLHEQLDALSRGPLSVWQDGSRAD